MSDPARRAKSGEVETAKHPYGSYRRRIRVVNVEPGLVDSGLEDDFHYFRVRVRHDGHVVTDIAVDAYRWPWTTCPDAGEQLKALVGMELSPRCLAVGEITNPRLQCTHQFDLAGLAIAHATRDVEWRQYDVEVPYGAQGGGQHDVRLWRDEDLMLTWTLDGQRCVAPEPYASTQWRGGFLKWADQTLDRDTAEAAIVLRRACDIAVGRGADLEGYRSAAELVIGGSGICYTFQPDTASVAFRQVGTIRDFDGRVDELLANGPRADPDRRG
jgi:Protein of unknown function (DUF2889)